MVLPYVQNKVCLPGLHISLGIFFRLYTLMEEACHELDLAAADLSNEGGVSFSAYSADLQALSKLKDEAQMCEHGIHTLDQLCTVCPHSPTRQSKHTASKG